MISVICFILSVRLELHDDVCEKISAARRDAIENMTKIKQRSGASQIEDELTLKQRTMNDRIKQIKHENLILNQLLVKMKAFTQWKQKNTEEHYMKQVCVYQSS